MSRTMIYEKPTTVDEVIASISDDENAVVIAGGTDLWVKYRTEGGVPKRLVSLRNIEALRRIETGRQIRIGAAATLADIASNARISEWLPALVAAIRTLGSAQIRNVATLGGNLCNASPAADAVPPLLVYNARVEVASRHGEREIPLYDLFSGPGQTTLRPGELLTNIVVERPPASARAVFFRKGRVRMDLATVCFAMQLDARGETCESARVAVGSVAPTPLRLTAVEEVLSGAPLRTIPVSEAQRLARASISPISDLRASMDYRSQLVSVFVKRAIAHLVGEITR